MREDFQVQVDFGFLSYFFRLLEVINRFIKVFFLYVLGHK